MPGPESGIAYLGCCGEGTGTEFAVFKRLRVTVNDFGQTAQQNSDFAEGILNGYDMGTIPQLVERRLVYATVSGAPTQEDVNIGQLTRAAIQAEVISFNQPRIFAERIVLVDGPATSVCVVRRNDAGTILECLRNQPLPQDQIQLPEITEPTPFQTTATTFFYFVGVSLGTPSCCLPPP